eukprot:12403993-Heterocapsa_arctica.AAC.1
MWRAWIVVVLYAIGKSRPPPSDHPPARRGRTPVEIRPAPPCRLGVPTRSPTKQLALVVALHLAVAAVVGAAVVLVVA